MSSNSAPVPPGDSDEFKKIIGSSSSSSGGGSNSASNSSSVNASENDFGAQDRVSMLKENQGTEQRGDCPNCSDYLNRCLVLLFHTEKKTFQTIIDPKIILFYLPRCVEERKRKKMC